MNGNLHYFGYEIEPALYQNLMTNMAQIEAGGPSDALARTAADHLVQLTQIGIQAYYERPASLISMPSLVRKAADTGMSTIVKAVEMVIHKVLSKRSLAELQEMVADMRQLVCSSEETPARHFICFPLPAHLYERSQTLLARVAEDPQVELYRDDIIGSLEELIEEAIAVFYSAPLAKVQVGRITRAAADVGITTVKKGSSMVLSKVFKSMPHSEMLPLAAYFETLLHQDLRPNSMA